MERIAGVVMAAGLSSRMKRFKPLLPFHGVTVIQSSVLEMLETTEKVFVVVGYRGAEICELFRQEPRVVCVEQPDYANEDMFSSLRLGLTKAAEYDGVFMAPGDIPAIGSALYKEILEEVHLTGCLWARPFWKGKGQHPVFIRHAAIRPILDYDGDDGLRGALHTLPEPPLELTVHDPACSIDIDTIDQYRFLLRYEECRKEGITLIRKKQPH